jgi:hypothetical protein
MSELNVLSVTLEVLMGPHKGEVKEFKKDLILVGRSPDNELSLPLDHKISRVHAEIHVGFDQVIVRNISERNFMLVSGREVSEATVKPQEILFIGESQIQILFDPPPKKKLLPEHSQYKESHQNQGQTQDPFRDQAQDQQKKQQNQGHDHGNSNSHGNSHNRNQSQNQNQSQKVSSHSRDSGSRALAQNSVNPSSVNQTAINNNLSQSQFLTPQGLNPEALVPGSLKSSQDKKSYYQFDQMKEAQQVSSGLSHQGIHKPFGETQIESFGSNSIRKVPFLNPLSFLVLIVVLVGGYILYSNTGSKKNKPSKLRTHITTMQSIQKSEEALESHTKESAHKKTVAYQQAQNHYLKGFRDYRNGNYSRAMEHFAAALAFYSEHDQAKRYYHLAHRKNEEFSQYHFNLGKRYYGIQNYRLCSAHFAIVIRSKRSEKDLLRQEALQFLKECDARQEGRY